MDVENAVIPISLFSAAVNILKIIEKRKAIQKRKRVWIKQWRKTRDESGNIQTLLNEYKLSFDNEKYKSYLRMDETCFNRLLALIEHDIRRQNTSMRNCIPVAEKLAVTLRFLATGENFKELDENTKLSRSYLQIAIMEVCEAIYRNWKDLFLKFPDKKETWIEIAKEFERRWQFLLCVGALDGKHIAFPPKKENAQIFHNYKGFKSIVLLALADAHARFLFVDVGCNGRISDGGILNRSDLMVIIKNAETYLPPPQKIGNDRIQPYVIIADNAFPLSENLMTPYPFTTKDTKKIYFNYRLSIGRQNIERAFGILSNRFRIVQKGIKLDEHKSTKIIQACCVLHNFLIINSNWYMENTCTVEETETVTTQQAQENERRINRSRSAEIRESFSEYFSNEGKM